MFYIVLLIILLVSFLLALKSARKLNEKPAIKEVKKSLDKDRVIFQNHSSST